MQAEVNDMKDRFFKITNENSLGGIVPYYVFMRNSENKTIKYDIPEVHMNYLSDELLL